MATNKSTMTFADVFDLQMGKTPSRDIPSYWSGDNVWVSIADMKERKYVDSSKETISDEAVKATGIRVVPEGTVFMSFKLSIGKVAIAAKNLYTNEAIMQFPIKPGYELSPKYLYYYLHGHKWQGANKAVMGATLNKKKIAQEHISFPPIEEQQRIVDELDLLTGIIDKKSAQLRDLDALAQSIFYEMFGDPETLRLKNTLGEVCSIVGRIGFRGYTRDDFVDGPEDGAISLSPANIINSEMNYDKCSYITWEKYDESPEIMIEDGDILVVKTGSSYGKTALVEGLPHKATINPQFVVLKQLSVDNEYLTAYLSTPFARRKYEEYVIGTAIPTFSQKKLASMPLLIPSTADQKRFSSAMSGIRNERRLIKQALEDNKSLLNSRMDFYFTD